MAAGLSNDKTSKAFAGLPFQNLIALVSTWCESTLDVPFEFVRGTSFDTKGPKLYI